MLTPLPVVSVTQYIAYRVKPGVRQRSGKHMRATHTSGAPPGLLEGLIAPAETSSSSYYLIRSYSLGLWGYIFLAMGSVPGLIGISRTSSSPLLDGTFLSSSAGKTLFNSFNMCSRTPLCSSGKPSRYGMHHLASLVCHTTTLEGLPLGSHTF